jgi:hypothetical protein
VELEKYMLPCFSKTLFGVECFGCGFQRAFLLLLKGNFVGAFQMYPALFTTLLYLGIMAFHFIYNRFFSQKTILIMTLLNILFMVTGYIYKHY